MPLEYDVKYFEYDFYSFEACLMSFFFKFKIHNFDLTEIK